MADHILVSLERQQRQQADCLRGPVTRFKSDDIFQMLQRVWVAPRHEEEMPLMGARQCPYWIERPRVADLGERLLEASDVGEQMRQEQTRVRGARVEVERTPQELL